MQVCIWNKLLSLSNFVSIDCIFINTSLGYIFQDLLFCPDFTVSSSRKSGPDNPEDMATIDSCEYIWEAGVGFAHSPASNVTFDSHRCEILKLILTCFSETMYLPPVGKHCSQLLMLIWMPVWFIFDHLYISNNLCLCQVLVFVVNCSRC